MNNLELASIVLTHQLVRNSKIIYWKMIIPFLLTHINKKHFPLQLVEHPMKNLALQMNHQQPLKELNLIKKRILKIQERDTQHLEKLLDKATHLVFLIKNIMKMTMTHQKIDISS